MSDKTLYQRYGILKILLCAVVLSRKLTYILKFVEVNAILNNDCFYFDTELNSSLKLMVDAVLINALD